MATVSTEIPTPRVDTGETTITGIGRAMVNIKSKIYCTIRATGNMEK